MEFFDKIGKKASEAYKVTADKTGKIAKEAKLKMKMADLKGQVNDIYKEIGKKVYEQHVREENMNIEEEIKDECTQIDELSEQIESLLKECMELRDKRQCPNCYTEIDKDMKFCPECGTKQEENVAKDVEILDKLEKVDNVVNEEEKNEKSEEIELNKEEKNEEQQSRENLEKTVEIESNAEKWSDEESKSEMETGIENEYEFNGEDNQDEDKE